MVFFEGSVYGQWGLEDNPVMKNDVVTLSNRWVEGESDEDRDEEAEGLQELWWQQ